MKASNRRSGALVGSTARTAPADRYPYRRTAYPPCRHALPFAGRHSPAAIEGRHTPTAPVGKKGFPGVQSRSLASGGATSSFLLGSRSDYSSLERMDATLAPSSPRRLRIVETTDAAHRMLSTETTRHPTVCILLARLLQTNRCNNGLPWSKPLTSGSDGKKHDAHCEDRQY